MRFLLGVFICCIPLQVFSADYNAYKTTSPIQVEFSDYMQNVRDKIHRNWNNPEIMEEGHVVLQFKITRNGDLFTYDIKQSSGNSVLDEYAVNALEKSAPFGEFPVSSNRDYITIVYEFDSSLVKTDKIKELVKNSEKYLNIDNNMARSFIDRAIEEADGDSIAYFLYARRYKIDRMMNDSDSAQKDMAEFKRLKNLYDKNRIAKCQKGIEENNTPFAHFALANAYDIAGDYDKAIIEINKAIGMTDLNNAYKRYRDEIISRTR